MCGGMAELMAELKLGPTYAKYAGAPNVGRST